MPVTKIEGKRGAAYRVRVELTPDAVTGKRQWHSETYATRRIAERRERELRDAVDRGTHMEPSTLTVAAYMLEFRRRVGEIRDNTWIRNGQDINRRILPYLGAARLADLRVIHIQQFIDDLTDDYAPATVHRCKSTLHHALDQAVAWQLIPANPCIGVRLPRMGGGEMQIWNEAQVKAFLAVTTDCPFAALWRLALLTGIRKGELLALQWRDLDFARQLLHVRRTMTRDKQLNQVLGAPKTRAGTRTIKLPALCVTALTRHHDALSGVREDHFVFGRHGDPARMIAHVTPNRMLTRYALEASVPPIRFHDLRHTAATLMLLQGVSPRVVQERLGHASIAITLGLYSHVTLTMQDDAADKMDAMFTPG